MIKRGDQVRLNQKGIVLSRHGERAVRVEFEHAGYKTIGYFNESDLEVVEEGREEGDDADRIA